MSPRLVMISGSGEMSPRMAPVHRAVVRRLAGDLGRDVRGVTLDTPYGFQENADDLTARTIRYFRDRVGLALEAVGLRRSGDPRTDLTATQAVRDADYVFAGPGSPSYALTHWRDSGVALALREKVETGGALSLASAAAVTMGIAAMPVYEIYKAGHDPYWLPGLDLLGSAGLRVAVVPHFDNREGRAHDTRFCYVGARRFTALEAELPAGAWTLGIDENTALVLDLDAQTAEVHGPGGVTVRSAGAERSLRRGSRFDLSELVPSDIRAESRARGPVAVGPGPRPAEPLDARVAGALEAGDAPAALGAVAELERLARGSDDAAERARLALRSALVALADQAGRGQAEKRRAASLVDTLVRIRAGARDAGNWETADAIRDALVDAGVSVRDTPEGPVWEPLNGRPAAPPAHRSSRARVPRS